MEILPVLDGMFRFRQAPQVCHLVIEGVAVLVMNDHASFQWSVVKLPHHLRTKPPCVGFGGLDVSAHTVVARPVPVPHGSDGQALANPARLELTFWRQVNSLLAGIPWFQSRLE